MTSAALAASDGVNTVSPAAVALARLLLSAGKADHNVEARIAQVQRVRVALAAVADDGDFLALEGLDVSVFFVEASWHCGELCP